MYIQIERVLTNLTKPHNVTIGSKSFLVSPGIHDGGLDIEPEAHVFAKMPHEDDWYDYGAARTYIYKTTLGYELWLFISNSQPITDFFQETNKKTSNNNNWW